jgi:hypothetical protein
MLSAVKSGGIKVVTNGLGLYYDAAMKQSYPGTGNTFEDLASGKDATFYGSKTWYSGNGGYFDDFFLNESYTLIDTSYSATNLSALTMVAVVRYDEGQYEGVNILASTNSGGNSFGLNTRFGGYDIAFTSDGGSRNAFVSLSQNVWYVVSAIRDVSTLSVSIRTNNNARVTNTYASMSNVSFTNGWMFARNRGTGTQYRGQVAAVLFYPRALTSDEEVANYHALKLRYGI